MREKLLGVSLKDSLPVNAVVKQGKIETTQQVIKKKFLKMNKEKVILN